LIIVSVNRSAIWKNCALASWKLALHLPSLAETIIVAEKCKPLDFIIAAFFNFENWLVL